MRLSEYIRSPCIPDDEQLYLVNNPRFPAEAGAHAVFPEKPGRLRRYLAAALLKQKESPQTGLREYVLSRFTLEQLVEKTVNVYKSLAHTEN